jgi:hypothetical protein
MLFPPPVNADQAAANLAEVQRVARLSLGLPASGTVPIERQAAYIREMARLILLNPAAYSELAVANARRWAETPDKAPLLANGMREVAGEFVSEFGNQALGIAEGAAAIGQGVVSTAKLTRWLIPAAAVVGVALLLWRYAAGGKLPSSSS